jgi:hypothetical protein
MDDEYALELEDDDPPPAGMYAITNQASLNRGGPDAPYGCAPHARTAAACAMALRHGSPVHQRAGQPPPAKQPRLESHTAAVSGPELITSAQPGEAAVDTDSPAGRDAAPELDMAAPENAAGLSALQRAAVRAKRGISPGGGLLPPPDAGQNRPSAPAATLRRVGSAAQPRQQQLRPTCDAPPGQPSTGQMRAAVRMSNQRQDPSAGRPQPEQPLAAQSPRSRHPAASQRLGRQPAAQPQDAWAPPSQQPVVDERCAEPRRGHATAAIGPRGLPTMQHLQQVRRDGCPSLHPAGLTGTEGPRQGVEIPHQQDVPVVRATQQLQDPKASAVSFCAADQGPAQSMPARSQPNGAPAHDRQPQRRQQQRPAMLTPEQQRRQPPMGTPSVGLH